VAGDSGVDSMFRFQLKSGGNWTKCSQMMKRMQRAHLGSMERKRHLAWWRGNIDRRRGTAGRGNEGDDTSWADANLTGLKNEENLHGQFSCTNGQ
jgi:hypothetical protein